MKAIYTRPVLDTDEEFEVDVLIHKNIDEYTDLKIIYKSDSMFTEELLTVNLLIENEEGLRTYLKSSSRFKSVISDYTKTIE